MIVEEHHWVVGGGGPGGPMFLASDGQLTPDGIAAATFATEGDARENLDKAKQLAPTLDWRVIGSGGKKLA